MPRREFQLTTEDRKKVLALKLDGYSMSDIATRFNIGTTLVWRICNNRELSKIKPKRKKLRRKP